MRIAKTIVTICLSLWLLVSLQYGCTKKNPAKSTNDNQEKLTCVDCHTNLDKLKVLAVPDTVSHGDSGET